jgi:hypothetical protein
MDSRSYRYKGHRFSVVSEPVHTGKGCTFFSDIHWFKDNKEEFIRYTCDRIFMTPQEARMEGIAIVRNWIDDGKPAVKAILQAMFKSERLLDQLRSALERSCKTVERSRVLYAEMERVLEDSKLALVASERQRKG